jgi:hypothetical protein
VDGDIFINKHVPDESEGVEEGAYKPEPQVFKGTDPVHVDRIIMTSN